MTKQGLSANFAMQDFSPAINAGMNNFLNKIKILKQEEIGGRKRRCPLSELKARIKDLPPPRNFKEALSGPKFSLIAEIKRASPSAGIFRSDFDPAATSRAYEEGGAAAISVLTEKAFFGGKLSYLKVVKEAVELPVMRKDFILDEYQVYESRAAGADAILLIAELLTGKKMKYFLKLSHRLKLSCLVEAHSGNELGKVLSAGANIVGINNRNLKTLQIALETSLNLLPLIPPDRIKVSESGIQTPVQVKLLKDAGADAILVGETLMRSKDIKAKIRELLGS